MGSLVNGLLKVGIIMRLVRVINLLLLLIQRGIGRSSIMGLWIFIRSLLVLGIMSSVGQGGERRLDLFE
jgi:hypothetical protein